MPQKRITDDDIKTITEALETTGGKIREATRLLAKLETPFGYGTVQNIAKNGMGHWNNARDDTDNLARLTIAHAKIRSLQSQKAHLLKQLGNELEFNDEILAAIGDINLPKLSTKTYKTKKKDGNPIIASLVLGDWHIGEVVSKNEVEGFNKFDYLIATKRIQYLTDKFLHWIETQREGYQIDDLIIFCVGDFISGNIHEELKEMAEFSAPVQVVKAAELLAYTLRKLSSHFNNIQVIEIGADNHARLDRKPRTKQKAFNSLNYPLYVLANEMIEDCKNVDAIMYESQKAQVDINGFKVLVEHGDSVKGWNGFPYYGIERQEGREAQKRLKANKPYDLHIFGHFHSPQLGPDWRWMVNGCLSGTTELDACSGRFANPSQTSFLINTKRRQIFNLVSWQLSIE